MSLNLKFAKSRVKSSKWVIVVKSKSSLESDLSPTWVRVNWLESPSLSVIKYILNLLLITKENLQFDRLF